MRNWCIDANATEMSAFSLYCRCFRGDHFVIISMIIVSWKRLGKPKTRLAVRKPLRSHKNTSAASSGNQSFEKHWVIYDLWCWGIVGKRVRGTHFYLEWGVFKGEEIIKSRRIYINLTAIYYRGISMLVNVSGPNKESLFNAIFGYIIRCQIVMASLVVLSRGFQCG